jgi:ATP phosphoribosyltransferase regulatory subunit
MVSDRAHLKGARVGSGLARLEDQVTRVLASLSQGRAVRVEPAALQPADVLLDLYGENIRARTFVTRDDDAEMMLRPDFTVPIARLHMESGSQAARYVYCGPVWRRQESGSSRAREYLQAGLEVFDAGDPAACDADVLALVGDALGDAPVDLVTGDMGLVLAAIDALDTSAARIAALRRHVWRPERFHQLLRRFGPEHEAVTAGRAGLLAAHGEGGVDAAVAAAGSPVGLRDAADITARVARLAEEAATRPLGEDQISTLESVLAVRGSCTQALRRFQALAARMPGLGLAVEAFGRRLEALSARGINPDSLQFEASFGRTTLEYYDGFVFGAIARGRPDLPPVASGGRYDALTRVLGRGRGVPAVGGIIRPEAMLSLAGGM